jgi:YegS/Rv2252/BmrU family lipid kinase
LLAQYSTSAEEIYWQALERAVIIYNPNARNAPKTERLKSAADLYRIHGWQIDLLPTEAAGHATLLAREAAEAGTPVIFSCGGDGTLNEVVNGTVHTPAHVSVIRGGTGNVFAKEINVGRTPEKALRVLIEGEEGRFDLGKANDRYFLLMCGIGFDASVVGKVPTRPKRLLGTTSYVLWGMAEATRYRGKPVRIRLGDDEEQEIDLYWLLLGNTRSYGGVLNITHEAIADDGLLDAYLFAGSRLPITTAARLAMQRQDGAPGVSFQRIQELEILTPGIPVQADGEYFGETPMTFTVEKQAVTFLMPPGQGRQLLSPPTLSLRARELRVRQRRRRVAGTE